MSMISRIVGWQNGIVRLGLSNTSTGAPLIGLTRTEATLRISTIQDVEASATVYTASGSLIDAITTLGTYAAPASGHCGFKEVDQTNHPGLYELQFSNTRLAGSGVGYLDITIAASGFNCLGQTGRIDLDPQVDTRMNGGVAVTSSGGRQEVNLTHIAGDSTRTGKLGTELDMRIVGTVTSVSFTPTTTQFECSDIVDADTSPVYINRGFLITSGTQIRSVGMVLTDIVGTAGRRFTVTALPAALASGDTILIL